MNSLSKEQLAERDRIADDVAAKRRKLQEANKEFRATVKTASRKASFAATAYNEALLEAETFARDIATQIDIGTLGVPYGSEEQQRLFAWAAAWDDALFDAGSSREIIFDDIPICTNLRSLPTKP